MATYENYLEYIKNEFAKINPNELSEDEKGYFEVVKRDLENSNTLPPRILKSPVSFSSNLDNETIINTNYTQSKTGLYGKINSIKDLFTVHKAAYKAPVSSLVINFTLITISIITSYFLTKSHPINLIINAPNMTWQAGASPSLPEPTEEPSLPLSGAAGDEDQENNKTENYTLQIVWNEYMIDISVIVWAIIPVLTILVLFYFPFIRQAWSK